MLDIDAAAAEDRTAWSTQALSARLLDLVELEEQVRAEVLRCAGEWDAALSWAADGHRSAAAWLAERAPFTTADAREIVRTARLVQANPTTAKALAVGDVSTAHVTVAARAARHVEDVYAAHEDVLLDAARATSPDDFRTCAAYWRSIAEDAVAREPVEQRFERRHLHLSPVLDDMMRIDGWVDAETGVRFARVLDALEPPDPADAATPRTLGQRRADALAKLAAGEKAPRVTLHGVVDVDTIQGRMPGDLTDARCDLVGAGAIDVATIVRMACDASLSRVLVQGQSAVLDLGRATPLVSDAQRRALAVRDGGCVEPGCTAPPEWCDAHHKLHWILGGPTNMSNLELRCRRHHVAAHRHRRGPPRAAAA
jgi:hypothetical protein